MKQLDEKFAEFENAAVQRENDYKHIIEQQRMDSEQLKGFETLKESNIEMRSVRGVRAETSRMFLNFRLFLSEHSKAARELSRLRQPL